MPKNPGCWASALDDCAGPLTGEHTLSVAVWPGENRRARLGQRVNVATTGRHAEPYTHRTVRQLTRDILCDHHNNSSNDLDTAAGRLSEAIEEFEQQRQNRVAMPGLNWAPWRRDVDGRLIERWFLKTVINIDFGRGLPIGDPAASPGWPTNELVEMVFGRRPIIEPYGLFHIFVPGRTYNFGLPEFVWSGVSDGAATHTVCGILMFRSMLFGVNLTTNRIPEGAFDAPLGLAASRVDYRFNLLNTERQRIEVRFVW
jgi:hypothetical protein